MSIAVSAVVQPSRLLAWMIAVMSITIALVGVAIGFGLVGDFPRWVRFSLPVLFGFIASFGFYHGMQHRKTIQLDISGAGQIRITKVDSKAPCVNANWPHVRATGEVFRLMPDSTLWPLLIVLRLKSEESRTLTVTILPDCVPSNDFRALSVAFRWISMHASSAKVEKF